MDPQGTVGVELQHLAGDGGGDVGVAVAVAAHPAAQDERAGVLGEREPGGAHLAVELAQQVGHGTAAELLHVPAHGAGLVGDGGLVGAQLVGLPQLVDVRAEPVVVHPFVERDRHPAQDRQHRLPRRLRRVRGEHRAQLQPGEDGVDLVGIGGRQPLHDPVQRRAARQLGGAVALLGDVGQLEELRERARQPHGGARVEAREEGGDGGVVTARDGDARLLAHLLHQLQQVRAAVEGDRLAEHRGQPADVGAQGVVAVLGQRIGDGQGGPPDGEGRSRRWERRLGLIVSRPRPYSSRSAVSAIRRSSATASVLRPECGVELSRPNAPWAAARAASSESPGCSLRSASTQIST